MENPTVISAFLVVSGGDASGPPAWRVMAPLLSFLSLPLGWFRVCFEGQDQGIGGEVEHWSTLERVAQLDEDIKVLKAQLEFAQLSVSKDQKRAESNESNSKALASSLETAQAELAKARDEANYLCTEWKSLGTEAKEMCQETLEIILDQVSHLCPGVDFSAITLKTRWDPKGRRIHVPEELLDDDAEVAEIPAEEGMGQQQ
ncbi:hypothetical protein PIB30_031069 [Stylosanthes scabra]|uniref:Uncharacterized protein n=1 Tax=Stylosanthes scabra TaxID=79078 RepID=A0ABU6SCA1_9FABA|nr:hypothetical protein [Stylosanthes scabra]